MLYSKMVEAVAIREIMSQEGVGRERISHANCGYPELTSAVTATFYVQVHMNDGTTSYEVPIVTRVNYTHPVATPDA